MDWEELSALLEKAMSGLTILPDGNVGHIRQLLPNQYGLNIQIYAREHAPPHFCLKYNEHEASYLIERDGPLTKLKGSVPKSQETLLKYLYEKMAFRTQLIKTWDETRPYDCPVGPVKN